MIAVQHALCSSDSMGWKKLMEDVLETKRNEVFLWASSFSRNSRNGLRRQLSGSQSSHSRCMMLKTPVPRTERRKRTEHKIKLCNKKNGYNFQISRVLHKNNRNHAIFLFFFHIIAGMEVMFQVCCLHNQAKSLFTHLTHNKFKT